MKLNILKTLLLIFFAEWKLFLKEKTIVHLKILMKISLLKDNSQMLYN